MTAVQRFFPFVASLALMVLVAARPAVPAPLDADMVIYNGKILTVDSPSPDNFRIAQAAAVYDGKFIAVGTNEEILPYAGTNTQKIDLGGRTVIPGLVETHDHIQGFGNRWTPASQRRVQPQLTWSSKDEGVAQLRTIALTKKPGEWITPSLRGLDFGLAMRKGEVVRADLDRVTPNNPVRLASIFSSPTGDSFVNGKAIELLLSKYPDLPGFHKDANGVPTGWLSGVVDQLIEYEFMPLESPSQMAPVLKLGMQEMAAAGVTTNSTRLAPEQLAGYAWLNSRRELPIRMAFSLEATARTANPDAIASRIVGVQGGFGKEMWGLGDDNLWTIGLSPISIDSVPGIGGSCISKEYPREAVDFPNWMLQLYGPHGLCRLEDPNYRTAEELRAAAKFGFRISGMHTGGDRGIDKFLEIMEEMSKLYPDIAERRWSVDHCRFLTEEHARRAQKLGLYFSCGPKYVFSGIKGDIGAYSVLYGSEVAADVVVPMRRLVDHNLRTTMQLDQQTFYSFLALETTVTRKDISGRVWGPQQRINRREALYTYTRWSSEYMLREDRIGSIEPRKLADFVVLDRDYLTIPDDEIGQIDPVLTVVGGRIAYSQPAFANSVGLPVAGIQFDRSHWLRGVPEDVNRGGGGGD
ncbi:MAG: amidohydrolase family protein [Acidobacteria bacterium]|nr:amidohydrolase family protein [Acidobacteriota bacterium]